MHVFISAVRVHTLPGLQLHGAQRDALSLLNSFMVSAKWSMRMAYEQIYQLSIEFAASTVHWMIMVKCIYSTTMMVVVHWGE